MPPNAYPIGWRRQELLRVHKLGSGAGGILLEVVSKHGVSVDQNEFSRRLRVLAGGCAAEESAPAPDRLFILGSLGFAKTVRQAQGCVLIAVIALGCYFAFLAFDPVGMVQRCGFALGLAAASTWLVKCWPYWTPRNSLRAGLLALSAYPFNDFDQFASHQRTALLTVNNTMLSDLCLQLALDRRRPDTRSR